MYEDQEVYTDSPTGYRQVLPKSQFDGMSFWYRHFIAGLILVLNWFFDCVFYNGVVCHDDVSPLQHHPGWVTFFVICTIGYLICWIGSGIYWNWQRRHGYL